MNNTEIKTQSYSHYWNYAADTQAKVANIYGAPKSQLSHNSNSNNISCRPITDKWVRKILYLAEDHLKYIDFSL